MLWFPGGPSLTFLPFPVPDGDKRPGSCPDHEHCGGHFLQPSQVVERRLQGVELPPSDALQKAHSDGSTDAGVLSTECTLPVEEVNIWLDHLTSVAANRKRGKAKAAETRSSKKASAPIQAPAPIQALEEIAPDCINVEVSRFGRRRRKNVMFSDLSC